MVLLKSFQDLATLLKTVEMCKLLVASPGHVARSTIRAHTGATAINAMMSEVSEKMRVESAVAKKIILQCFLSVLFMRGNLPRQLTPR